MANTFPWQHGVFKLCYGGNAVRSRSVLLQTYKKES